MEKITKKMIMPAIRDMIAYKPIVAVKCNINLWPELADRFWDNVITIFHVDIMSIKAYDPVNEIIYISPHYLIEQKDYKRYHDEILNKLNTLIPKFKAVEDEYARELLIHDSLAKNVTYEDFGRLSHTIVGPLLLKKGVCDGISKTAHAFFKLSGIESYLMSGTASDGVNPEKAPHQWNMVRINDEYYQLDITFDASGNKQYKDHTYFNVSKKAISKDHEFDKKSDVLATKCILENDYFQKNNLVFKKSEELYSFLLTNLKQGKKIFQFKYLTSSPTIRVVSNIVDSIGLIDSSLNTKSPSIIYNEPMNVVTLFF